MILSCSGEIRVRRVALVSLPRWNRGGCLGIRSANPDYNSLTFWRPISDNSVVRTLIASVHVESWPIFPVGAANMIKPFSFVRGFRSAVRLLGNRQRLSFALLIAERVAVGICDLLLAGAMYLLFLLLQSRAPSHHFWWIPKTTLSAALITSGLVVLRASLDLFSTGSVVGQIQSLYRDFLLRLTHGYSEMRWSRFVECNRSELLNHSIYTVREAANFYQQCIELIAAVVVVAVMTVALVYQSPVAACGLGAAVALFYGVHRFLIRKQLQLAASEREHSLRMLQRSLADMFTSGKEIRTYGNEAFFHDRIGDQAGCLAASNRRVALLPQLGRILSDQGVVLLFLCIVVAVELRHGDVRRLLSLLVFYFVLSRRMLPLISQISLFAGQMEGSYENVLIVDSELNECLMHRTPVRTMQLPSAGFVLELDQVSFSFDEGPPILRNATLRLREGESIVLRGVSGSGKSSLLNLIAGVSQPATGAVRVNSARVAYVPQEIALLDDSIRNNLLFGLAKKSDVELMNALAAAKLNEFVTAQPLGLETGVGDNGILFSGGQRQRLGLARAILRGATLLLLDEATSALDEENEEQVLKNLGAAGIAVVLTTHRVHKQFCDQRVCWLQEGHLIEESEAPWISPQFESSDCVRKIGGHAPTLLHPR
jgi:ABC-type transport system involved in cytochrome bd biosynthesis fused ATPase/permease subunit